MANIEISTFTRNNDGNTYVIKDANAMPKTGSNQISGDLIPSTDNSIDVGSSTKNIKMLYTKGITIDGTQFLPSDYIPRSGGAVLTGGVYCNNTTSGSVDIFGGTAWHNGAGIALYGGTNPDNTGVLELITAISQNNGKSMWLYPSGTWTWNGTACQITSDQRYKQQIAEIDDRLLDAWEDVNLVQFKYNDAVDQKGKDKARLHTGYVVQQIDNACKSHNVDVSKYGLYCHEEYPEETEEIEVEQADGTKTKECKVIREASEHYSLRYTEVYAIECAYLRRENARLKQQMQQYTESLSKLEERLKALEQTSK